MSKHFAADANDANEHSLMNIPAPEPRSLRLRIARQVSNILAPVTISIPLVILVAIYDSQSVGSSTAAVYYACIAFFFLSVLPAVYIVIGVRLGKISDVNVSKRGERAGPFLFNTISNMVGLFVLALLHGPKNLETLLIILAFMSAVLMVITWWWKISMHTSSLSVTVTILTALYGVTVLPAYLLVVLLSWSRVVLRRHTVAQVIAGSLVSMALATFVLLIRGV
jgi:membrane-associated phospholipid phosphatase